MKIIVKEGQVHLHLHAAADHGMKLGEFVTSDKPEPGLEWSEPLLDGKRVSLKEAEKAIAELGDMWRMPTLAELQSIVDYSKHNPAIDLERFPNTPAEPFWTGSPCAWNSDARWVVYFGSGYVLDDLDYGSACARACRASQ